MIFGIDFSARWIGFPRYLVPALVTIALLIIQLLPWLRSTDAMMPSLVVMSLFFWSVRAPKLCPPILAFAVGAIADLSELTPLGSQAIVFLLLVMALRKRPRLSQLPFLRLWVLFGFVCLTINLLLWLLTVAIGGVLMPFAHVLEQSAFAVVLFPIVTKFLLMPIERLIGDNPHG